MKENPLVIKNNKNQQLIGMVHIPDKEGKLPTVIFLHGFGGTKSEAHKLFVNFSRALCENGYIVYRFDFRGSGDSYGNFEDMTLTSEIEDFNTIMNFVKKQEIVDINKIGLVGLSFGVSVSICSEPKEIKAMVLLSGVFYLRETFERVLEEWEEGRKFIRRGKIVKSDFLDNLDNYDVFKTIKNIKCPILFVHLDKDPNVNVKNSLDAFEAANEPKTLEIIKGNNHTFEKPEEERKVINFILDWFNKYLK